MEARLAKEGGVLITADTELCTCFDTWHPIEWEHLGEGTERDVRVL
jgi:hypothetical protein